MADVLRDRGSLLVEADAEEVLAAVDEPAELAPEDWEQIAQAELEREVDVANTLHLEQLLARRLTEATHPIAAWAHGMSWNSLMLEIERLTYELEQHPFAGDAGVEAQFKQAAKMFEEITVNLNRIEQRLQAASQTLAHADVLRDEALRRRPELEAVRFQPEEEPS